METRSGRDVGDASAKDEVLGVLEASDSMGDLASELSAPWSSLFVVTRGAWPAAELAWKFSVIAMLSSTERVSGSPDIFLRFYKYDTAQNGTTFHGTLFDVRESNVLQSY